MFNNNGRSAMPGPPSLDGRRRATLAQAPVNAQMLRRPAREQGLAGHAGARLCVASRTAMEPWSYELAGRFDEHELRERRPEGQPARRPARAAALGLRAAGLRRRRRAALPVDLRDPGPDRPARHVAQPHPVPAELPRARGRDVRARGVAAVPARLRRRVDVARRKPVHRLARDRPLPHVHLRGDRAVRGRALPDARRRPSTAGSRASRAAATARW